MKKVAHKYGSYTTKRSRSGQIWSPYENIAWVSCFKGQLGFTRVLGVIWEEELDGGIHFLFDSRQGKDQVALGQISTHKIFLQDHTYLV